jgi:poly [ADP-ribose] polymerase
MSSLRSVMLVMTNVDGNNNKYWKAEIHNDNSFHVTNGRVGGKGQTQPAKSFGNYEMADKLLERKMKEKLKKGYVLFDGITDSATLSESNFSLEKVAMEQIRTKTDPSIVGDLVKFLVEKNKHSILSKTDLEFDDESGLFKTPLGFVTRSSIDKAMSILVNIEKYIQNNDFDNSKAKTLLSEYLMLIPQKVGAKLSVKGVLPNSKAIMDQNTILDDLMASIEQVESGALDAKNKEKEKNKKDIVHEQIFNTELSLVSDKAILKNIEMFYQKTRKSIHASHHLKVARVFEVTIDSMKKDFDTVKGGLGNIKQLWHGTRAGNVLSILKSGLMIPPTNAGHVTGRMFGNGLYFSDESTKSLNYAYGYWDGGSRDNTCYMFLCDVAMGLEYTPDSWRENLPKRGYDSTFAKGGESGVENNEMIVYSTKNATPRYLVEFQ